MNFIEYTMKCAGFKLGKVKMSKGDAVSVVKMTDEEKSEFAEVIRLKRRAAFNPSSSAVKFSEN